LSNICNNIEFKYLDKNNQNLKIIFIFKYKEKIEILYFIYKIDKNLFNIYIILDNYFKNIYNNYYYINNRSRYDFYFDNINDIPKIFIYHKLFIIKIIRKNIKNLYLKNI
jgi:hypothetical protein